MLPGRDSSVRIATRYGLDGPGIETRCGRFFSIPVQTGPVAHSASYKMGSRFFPRVTLPGLGVDHPPTSSVEFEDRVNLYLYPPFGPSWTVIGWTLPKIWNENQLMSLFYSYIAGSLHVSGPQAHLQESSYSCWHNHWFSFCAALFACSAREQSGTETEPMIVWTAVRTLMKIGLWARNM